MPRVAGTCRRYDVVVVFMAVVGLLLLGHAAVAPCGDVGSLLLFVHVASSSFFF
jgi:putative copper export protein